VVNVNISGQGVFRSGLAVGCGYFPISPYRSQLRVQRRASKPANFQVGSRFASAPKNEARGLNRQRKHSERGTFYYSVSCCPLLVVGKTDCGLCDYNGHDGLGLVPKQARPITIRFMVRAVLFPGCHCFLLFLVLWLWRARQVTPRLLALLWVLMLQECVCIDEFVGALRSALQMI
jgi:hypothetical protein